MQPSARVPALDVSIRAYEPRDLQACRALHAELVVRHREIYGDPTIGGDDPGAGFDDHLVKPVDPTVIGRVLAEYRASPGETTSPPAMLQ